jgi:hypothetical protein
MATITRGTDFFDKTGDRSVRYGKYTGPASYLTGGDALAPEQLAMGRIDFLIFEDMSNGTDLRRALYDYAAKKVKWFDYAGAEIGNGTALNTYSGRFMAIGK